MCHFINLTSHIFPQCVSGLPINGIEPSLPPQSGSVPFHYTIKAYNRSFDNPVTPSGHTLYTVR